MQRLILDMDGVLADTYFKFVDLYEERHGRRPTAEELRGKKVYDLPGAEGIRDAMHERGFFRDVPPVKDAVEVARELSERFELFVVTQSTEFKHSFLDKWEWLEEHLPFVPYTNYVFCGNKSITTADFCIDDKLHNLDRIGGTGLLFTSYDNLLTDPGEHTRVDDWAAVRAYFQTVPAGEISVPG